LNDVVYGIRSSADPVQQVVGIGRLIDITASVCSVVDPPKTVRRRQSRVKVNSYPLYQSFRLGAL